MIRKISIFSVITLLMTLFVLAFLAKTYAYSYEKGYEALNEKTEYVDIIMPNMQALNGNCYTISYGKNELNQSKYNYMCIKRTRYINNNTDNTLVTEYYPYYNGDIIFKLFYNDFPLYYFHLYFYYF